MVSQESISNTTLEDHEQLLSDLFDSQAMLTIMDIGAWQCDSSLRYQYLFPRAVIYAFEPLPRNLDLANHYISQFQPNAIHLFGLCLSDEDGTAVFHVSNSLTDDEQFGLKSSSLFAPDLAQVINPQIGFETKIVVATRRLDGFMKEHLVHEIDFIHMDVQGAELKVLHGMGDRLKDLKCIWLEVERMPVYKGQALKKDVEKLLKVKGFVKVLDTVNDVSGDQFWINGKYEELVARPTVSRILFHNKWRLPLQELYYQCKSFVKKMIGRY